VTAVKLRKDSGENLRGEEVEELLKKPSDFAPGWFRVDPNFAPREATRSFERLLATR
jgi:hypothetical protein